MKNKTLKQTEKEVLAVYKTVSPSVYKIEKTPAFKNYQQFRESLFRDRLKFPLPMFKGAELLDFGSGTGEQDIFYAKWGAKITGMEMNDISVARCKKIFKEHGLVDRISIHNRSLFDFKSEKKFDIVASNGVLHHTGNQKLGFKKLVSYLKPGGFVYISIGNNAGAFQRNLQRAILYKLAKSEKEISRLAKILFSEHLKRAAKGSKRSIDSVIYDSYVVPKADNASAEEILEWFNENHIKFYSSWPPLQFPFSLVDSPRRDLIDYTQKKYRDLISFSEHFWMMANEDDRDVIDRHFKDLLKINNINKITGFIKDVTPDLKTDWRKFGEVLDSNRGTAYLERVYKREMNNLSLFLKELSDLIAVLNATNDVAKIKKQIDKSRILFNGYCGLGDAYYMGYK